MDKITIKHKIAKNKEIDFFGEKIEVIPFLTTDKQIFLIQKYVENYFTPEPDSVFIKKPGTYNYISAELNLMNYLMQINTNIETSNIDHNFYSDSYFCKAITSQIKNYDVFRDRLDKTVQDIKEELYLEKSIGTILENISEKLLEVLNGFKDLSPEEIEKLQETGSKMLKELESSSLLGEVKS